MELMALGSPTTLLQQLLTVPGWVVLLVAGGLVFVEDAVFVGFVLPGETAAILAGVAAHQGRVPLWAVLATVIGAAVVGDSVGYEVGRILGPRVLRMRLLDSRRERLESAQDLLRRRGGLAVLLGRWVAFFRAVMPALAGIARMPYRRFLLFNALGGLVWGAAVVLVGYGAGASYEKVAHTVGRTAALVVAALVVTGLAAWHVRKRRVERV